MYLTGTVSGAMVGCPPVDFVSLAWEGPRPNERRQTMARTIPLVIATATLLALVASATLVAADDGGIPDCPPAQEQEISQEVGYLGEQYHFNLAAENTSKLGVWSELNTWPGLQTDAGACDYFGEIRSYPADVDVVSPPQIQTR